MMLQCLLYLLRCHFYHHHHHHHRRRRRRRRCRHRSYSYCIFFTLPLLLLFLLLLPTSIYKSYLVIVLCYYDHDGNEVARRVPHPPALGNRRARNCFCSNQRPGLLRPVFFRGTGEDHRFIWRFP